MDILKFKNAILLSALWFLPMLSMAEIEYEPLNISALQEFGMVYNGQLDAGQLPFERIWVDHLGAFVNQNARINDRFSAMVGFGGIFQFPLPERPSSAGKPPSAKWPSLRTKFFFIAPSGHLQYVFGDPEYPWLKIKGGLLMPYKYNHNAHNLGEYLIRTEPYPNLLTSGGMLMANSSAAFVKGLIGEMNFGAFNLDLLLLTESSMPPLYNLSLAAVGKYTAGEGIFELGAGVNFKRFIPVINESSKNKESAENAYVKLNGRYVSGNVGYYLEPQTYYENQAKSLRANNNAADSALANIQEQKAIGYERQVDIIRELNSVVFNWEKLQTQIKEQPQLRDSLLAAFYAQDLADVNAAIPGASGVALDSLNDLAYIYQNIRGYEDYYPYKGIMLSAFASLDLGKIVDPDKNWVGPKGLRIFAEAALLGVQDYPVFYEDKTKRMPIMFGFNLPTFGILDVISLQAEIYNSEHLNLLNGRAGDNNIPGYPLGTIDYYSELDYSDVAKKDNLKWSVLLQKQFSIVSFQLQFARDHLRLVHDKFFLGPGFESGVMTPREDSWYWAFQMGMGI